jgi:hydroxyethylthiazole kinase-like uncharacterized protein yjeF
MIRWIGTFDASLPLHGTAASRRIEARAAVGLPRHALMQRAGLAVARLALAIAPHARRVWVVAGPGNNGGDGFEAAAQLHAAGREVHVTAIGDPNRLPADAAASLARAAAAGVAVAATMPAIAPEITIDALLGLGASRAPSDAMQDLIAAINGCSGPRLAIDLPTGLDAETGRCLGARTVAATHTLALLTLKPGLFTGAGREHCGDLWFDDLDAGPERAAEPADAWCAGRSAATAVRAERGHAGHKGRFGDVIAVGGAPGMAGALVLAARAALRAGAGRVFANALDPSAPAWDAMAPELMWRPAAWHAEAELPSATVIAGCGGGDAIRDRLPALISRSGRLVLDADALNAIAADAALQSQLEARSRRGGPSVLTPHPLEAARLLGWNDASAVQAHRLHAAQALAERFGCTVVLKGSGSVIAAPQRVPALNPTGNSRLASPGTGDVLAGWLGGLWSAAQAHGAAPDPFDVAQAATWWHGAAAHGGDTTAPLTASALLDRLAAGR